LGQACHPLKIEHAGAALIEQALIFALGFLSCALLSLLILPAVWRRAVRLSTRRLEMLMPLSMDEVTAQRDQLRAQAAVEQRRIEQRLEAMTRDRARHMSEIGRNAGVIAGLEAEIERLTTAMDTREGDLAEAWTELGALHTTCHDLTSRLRTAEEARSRLDGLRQQFDVLRVEKTTLELQMNSLRAQDRALRLRLETLERELADRGGQENRTAMAERRGHEIAAAVLIAAHGTNRPNGHEESALLEPIAPPRALPDQQPAAN
jgi:septal ring factor EnvC (AmiA/AmiB activator)